MRYGAIYCFGLVMGGWARNVYAFGRGVWGWRLVCGDITPALVSVDSRGDVLVLGHKALGGACVYTYIWLV